MKSFAIFHQEKIFLCRDVGMSLISAAITTRRFGNRSIILCIGGTSPDAKVDRV